MRSIVTELELVDLVLAAAGLRHNKTSEVNAGIATPAVCPTAFAPA